MSAASTSRQSMLVVRSPELGWSVLLDAVRDTLGLTFAATTDQIDEAIRLATEHQRDLVLLADVVAGDSAIELATSIRVRISPSSRLIVVGSRIDEDQVAGYLALGVAGYLVWPDVTRETLDSYLRLLTLGATIYSPSVAPLVMRFERGERKLLEAPVHLTARERDVLKLLCREKTSKEIVGALGVSASTVKRNVATLKHKLNVSSHFGLGAEAARLQLCSEERR